MSQTEPIPFDEARFQEWLAACQKIITDYIKANYQHVQPTTLLAERGKRYIRIVNHGPGTHSAWAFVDVTNGDILKSASWKAPAKHARGNLYDAQKGLGSIGPYGPAYLRQ